MKRNKNFLLIVWAASLFLGLSAVRTAHAADTGYFIPDELAVFETVKADTSGLKSDSVHALLSASEFKADKKEYNLTSAYKSKLLLLAFKWKEEAGTSGVTRDSAKVKVFVGSEEVKKLATGKGDRDFLDYSDDVYVIPFGTGVDTVRGRVDVEVKIPAFSITRTESYEATIVRGLVDDITALRRIWITDSIKKGDDDKYQDIIFEKKSGDDGMLKPEAQPWEVSFKELDKTVTDHRGRVDTLHFTKYDALSTVKVIVNGKDTLKEVGAKPPTSSNLDSIIPTGLNEIYKVKIEAGNSYAIEVTARDSFTKGYYYVTLLADTLRPVPKQEETDDYNNVKFMLKDLYLYEGEKDNPSRRYTLRADTSGKVGFSEDTLAYKVTAPWSSVKVGYDFYFEEVFKNVGKEVVVLKYEKETSGERFIEVRVTKPQASDTEIRGGHDTTYVIRVLSGDNQLKSLRLSYDQAGTRPLELTRDSAGAYTSVAVDYTVASVFAWAAVEDAKAKIVDGVHWTLDTAKNEYRRTLDITELTTVGGGKKTFNVPVRAEDSTLTNIYKVTVNMKWDPAPKLVSFKWSGNSREFTREYLRAASVFDIKIPANANIEDITPEVQKSDDDLFHAFQSWQVTSDGVYSYVVKVTAKPDGSSKTYTFNMLRPSNDASLSHLYVPGFELDPAFAPDHTEYTVIVPSGQASINFIAQARHGAADVTGDREHTLHGDSTFTIVVTAEDGTKKTYRITVTGDPHTGIQLAGGSSVQVYVSDQSLHVSTPAAERVSVYSAGGQLLYSLDKPAGKAFVSTFPKGVLIVKGSSGWVKKVALH
jgi:hypothetical protein